LFGGEGEYTIEIDNTNTNRFSYVITALKNLFSNKPTSEQEAVQPIKIVINIFTEHDELLQHLLPHIAPDFIDYFYTYGNEVNSTFKEDVFKAGIKLIDSISTFFHV